MANFPVSVFSPEAYPIQQGTAVFNETQASGVNGGTFTTGSWLTRTLNTVVKSQAWASLSSNEVTLSPGNYLIEASAPAVVVAAHKIRIFNVTDSVEAITGTSEFTNVATGVANRSFLIGEMTFESSKTIRIEHQGQATAASIGFGVNSGFGDSEVYSILKITKLA